MTRALATGASAAWLTLLLLALTPYDRYIQWQDERTEAFARLGWIYERVHFDPTPIDIAFIGTSHTMNGIDGTVVAARTGASVTNFAIPAYGRDLHWLIARELLRHRAVGTLVIEVDENETRRSHPVFFKVASVADTLGAPLLLNVGYFRDLALLPLDHALLGLKTLWPRVFGLHRRFDPARYDGPDPVNTGIVRVHGEAFTGRRDSHEDPAALDLALRQQRAAKRYNMLPLALAGYEYAVPLFYLRSILRLAAEQHVEVVFLYLPGFGQDALPHDPAPYRGYPMLTVNDLLAPHEVWFDFAHLNAAGAAAVSARVGELLSSPNPVTRAVGDDQHRAMRADGRGADCSTAWVPGSSPGMTRLYDAARDGRHVGP